jgi:predicted transcriptional regulator of viral defense system
MLVLLSTKRCPLSAREHHNGMVKIRDLFRLHGGVLRTRDALRLGIHPRTLYRMRETGELEQLTRGLYRLTGLPKLSNPDLVSVSLKIPQGVICLISALALHELTTQVPHQVYIALPRGAEPPRISHPPLRVFWFAEPAFREGIEMRKIDGIAVRVYSAEKTIADCFKYRNKIGLDVPLKAVKLYRRRRKTRTDELLRYAAICRVEKIMRPYLEALL